jgi:PilZ domain
MPLAERRKFVRHPISVPLEYRIMGPVKTAFQQTAKDLSVGGISFFCITPPPLGVRIKVKIASTNPPFETDAIVVRTNRIQMNRWEVGIAFEESQAWFRARMVAQICHIKAWQMEQHVIGRRLTFEEAAEEWIDKNAAHF